MLDLRHEILPKSRTAEVITGMQKHILVAGKWYQVRSRTWRLSLATQYRQLLFQSQVAAEGFLEM